MNTNKTIPQYQLYGSEAKNNIDSYFNIQRIDLLIQKNGSHHKPHRHPNLYQIVWIVKGEGLHLIDDRSHKLIPNSLYFLLPGIVHTCESNKELDGYIIHFSRDLLNSNTSFSKITDLCRDIGYQIGKASSNNQKEINSLFRKMHQEFLGDRKDKYFVIQSLLTILLVYKNRLVLPKQIDTTSKSHHLLTEKFKYLVGINFKKERSVSMYANNLNVSSTYLNDCVKKATGLTATMIIKKQIILESKRLLLFSQLNISEIAYSLGFNEPNYFWKYFKKETNLSPGSFRKQRKLD